MLRCRSLQVVVIFSLILNTSLPAAFTRPSRPLPFDTGMGDKSHIPLNSSGPATMGVSHADSAQIVPAVEDKLVPDANSATSASQGSGITSRVSIASDGAQGNGKSEFAAISADGRYAVFSSQASNLVSDDSNNAYDVFVHDRQTGQTTRVSMTSSGGQGNGPSFGSSISADGRYVAFKSFASNLVSGDTNNEADVFVHDRQIGQTTRVSIASNGTQGTGPSIKPAISGDGRYVAFESWAGNLVSGDTNDQEDVFVHDRQTGQTLRVSVASNGTQANDESDLPAISADRRYVAFASEASNLVSGDNNNVCDTDNNGVYTDNCPDVFIRDLQTGQTSRISVASDGTQANGWSAVSSLSSDGRYVAFESQADNLVSGDTNGVYDIFVHDRLTGQTYRVSVASDGTEGNGESRSPSISADGRYVGFVSQASLVSDDTNGMSDIYVRDRQTGQTVRVSIAADGRQGNGNSRGAILSADGHYVAFSSSASNLVGGDTNAQEDVFVHNRGGGQSITIVVPLVSGSDDAGVEMNCLYRLDWREIYFGRCNDGSSIVSGFRFRNVQIPSGAIISEAYLEFTVDGPYSNDIALQFLGQASANSAPFSDTDRPTDRPLTTASVSWSILAADVWTVGQSHRSPDLAAIAQEIINLPGWVSGNALTIIARADPAFNASTHRRVFAWEREPDATHTARLVVTYQRSDNDTIPPDGRITSPADGSTLDPSATSIPIRAEAWDNAGGSGVDRVRFFVTYDGERHWACTDQDANPSCNWTIPSGLTSQQLILTINVVDRAGNIKVDAGGPVRINYQSSRGDTTPPDGRITSPADGTTIGPDTTLISIRAEAWDNAGGSGVDRVRFFVEYNGQRHWACTDQDNQPSCNWAIPPGLPSQQFVLSIDVIDRAGNVKENAGGPIRINYRGSSGDTTPPDGRITSPADGATFGPGTEFIPIRAEAWDNPGGSGVDRVRFYVTYDGAPHWACTDQDNLPSCTWVIPPGLTSQQLVLTINVVDHAGNIKYNAGGSVRVNYQRGTGNPATLAASPASVPADGSSTSTITLSGAPAGHQVRLFSNRGSVDTFANATGIVNGDGRFVTTIRSSVPGTAVIRARDLTAGQEFDASTLVDFRPVDERVGVVRTQGQGFDKCAAPSVSDMQTWRINSPYRTVGIYLPSAPVHGCRNGQPHLTTSWISQVAGQGWRFMPIWVGPQAPCTSYSLRFSNNPDEARREGAAQADDALDAAQSIGLVDESRSGTIIYYDMERYEPSNTACRNAVNAFVEGWVSRLRAQGNQAGVYGHSVNVDGWYTLTNAPDAVWFVYYPYQQCPDTSRLYCYDPNAKIYDIPRVPNSHWEGRRIRQYNGTHTEKYGGLSLSIDSDVLDGLVVAVGNAGAAAIDHISTTFTTSADSSAATDALQFIVQDMDLITAAQGWALVNHRFLWTTSGGEQWTDITPSANSSLRIDDAFFLGTSHGWVMSSQPSTPGDSVQLFLWYTGDGGKTWHKTTFTVFDPNDGYGGAYLHFIDPQTGWVIIRLASSSIFSFGLLFKTSDGGETWTQLTIPIDEPVRFITPKIGWTAGGPAGDQLYMTQDGGYTWEPQIIVPPETPNEYLTYSLPTFEDAQKGVLPILINEPTLRRIEFYVTQDGGQSWSLADTTPIEHEVSLGASVPVSVIDSNHWVVPTSADLVNPPANIVALDFVTPEQGWVYTSDGTCTAELHAGDPSQIGESIHCDFQRSFLKTADRGRTWVELELPHYEIYLPLVLRIVE